MHILLAVFTVFLALTLTALTYWRQRQESAPTSVLSLGWLWLLWFLAAPYGHYVDEILLAPVLVALFTVEERAARLGAIVLLYGAALSVLATTWFPGGVSLLPVLPAAALAVFLPLRFRGVGG